MHNSKTTQSSAAYQAACVQFVNNILSVGSPRLFIDTVTDATLTAVQSDDLPKETISMNQVLIYHLRELLEIKNLK